MLPTTATVLTRPRNLRRRFRRPALREPTSLPCTGASGMPTKPPLPGASKSGTGRPALQFQDQNSANPVFLLFKEKRCPSYSTSVVFMGAGSQA